jgi:hypothetical protein
MSDADRPVRFEQVLDAEIDLIAAAREATCVQIGEIDRQPGGDTYTRAHRASLCGLALSGGGIRSATFNLGVLQAAAKHHLLNRFDYLSTVSGGGYIGAWLSAWVHRHPAGVLGVEQALREGLAGRGEEPREVGWLRDYSNYLMVRLGFFSGDSWATIAIYLRNLCLNLTLIIACLAIAVLLPRLLVIGLRLVPVSWFGPLALGLIAVAIAFTAVNLQQNKGRWDWTRGHAGVLSLIAVPGVVAALMLAHALVIDLPGAAYVRSVLARAVGDGPPLHRVSWYVTGMILYTLPWLAAAAFGMASRADTPHPRFRWRLVLLFAPPSGVLLGVLCYAYSQAAVAVVSQLAFAGPWLTTAFGTPILVVAFCLVLVLHIGLVSRGFSEDIREWWGRLGGWAALVTLLWTLGFAVVVYAPALVAWTGDWIAALGVGWLMTTLAGVLLGSSSSRILAQSRRAFDWIITLLPFVFVAGLLIAITVAAHALLAPDAPLCDIGPGPSLATGSAQAGLAWYVERSYCELALVRTDLVLVWVLGLALLAFVLQLRVDVNVFSLGPLYRNRLLRCYLGASRFGERRPHPFTGFDRDDDVDLAELTGTPARSGSGAPQRPYPIINAAINLTTGEKLAWQSRKAGAFAFTPLFCGYQMPAEGSGRWVGRYCWTKDYVAGPTNVRRRGSIALSNAVTISGAAASPNAGYHSSPPVAFLLTVFNVRLGSWFQNPRRLDAWRRPGPRHALGPLLSELFGLSNDRSDFVYLSDGGHFENLGIYELVRRRCRFIVACDASCDPDSGFEDLGNAIRKCRIDLDVDIEIDTSALRPQGESGASAHHCALGLLRYDRADPRERVGYLLYVKPSICGDEPLDVAQYRIQNPSFPHQGTGDQFFDEAQFESYRRLGLHIMDSVLSGPIAQARSQAYSPVDSALAQSRTRDLPINLETLFKQLRQRWFPPLAVAERADARHAEQLNAIYDRIRSDERLRFLDRQLYPEWPQLEAVVGARSPEQPWLPDDVIALRAAFYLCSSIIQLMEQVYGDLHLEINHDHPDNRGWMNLFRGFAHAGMLRVTWALTSASYGARFQSFCERRFGLGDIALEMAELASVAEVSANAGLVLPGRDVLKALVDSGELAQADVVVRFDLRVRRAQSRVPSREAFAFPVAFAVLRALPQSEQPLRLRYFRVADHLQRMGLGWRATLLLLAHYPRLELDPATRAPGARILTAEADRARYVRLFRAARRVAGTG